MSRRTITTGRTIEELEDVIQRQLEYIGTLTAENSRLRASAVGADVGADRQALTNLVKAWETLPGGQNHSARAIESWLVHDMAPAINAARRVLAVRASVGADEIGAEKTADTSVV